MTKFINEVEIMLWTMFGMANGKFSILTLSDPEDTLSETDRSRILRDNLIENPNKNVNIQSNVPLSDIPELTIEVSGEVSDEFVISYLLAKGYKVSK